MQGTTLTAASRQWATRPDDQRFETLDSLFASVNARKMQSRERVIDIEAIEARADGSDIVLNHGIKEVSPTHWAFSQLCSNIGAPANFMRELPADLAALNLNNRIQANKGQAFKCMTLVNTDGGRNKMQAMTGPEYGRIFDADVAQLAMRIVAQTNGRFHNPLAYDRHTGTPKPSGLYASDRDIFMFLIDGGSLLEAGPRAKLNRGFFLSNSEVGKSVLALTMFYFNTVCGNHFVYGANGVVTLKIKHTSGGPGRFINEAMPRLLSYVNESGTGIISSVKRAQDYLLPVTKKDEIIEWLQDPTLAKLTKSEALGAYETAIEEEKECRTLWNAIQGITAYARDFAFVDARNLLEAKASRLMRLVS